MANLYLPERGTTDTETKIQFNTMKIGN